MPDTALPALLAERPAIPDGALMPVRGDAMSPALQHGDAVAVRPTDRWQGPGLYVVHDTIGPRIFRCQPDPVTGEIALRVDNPLYLQYALSLSQFERHVLGVVTWCCRRIGA